MMGSVWPSHFAPLGMGLTCAKHRMPKEAPHWDAASRSSGLNQVTPELACGPCEFHSQHCVRSPGTCLRAADFTGQRYPKFIC